MALNMLSLAFTPPKPYAQTVCVCVSLSLSLLKAVPHDHIDEVSTPKMFKLPPGRNMQAR